MNKIKLRENDSTYLKKSVLSIIKTSEKTKHFVYGIVGIGLAFGGTVLSCNKNSDNNIAEKILKIMSISSVEAATLKKDDFEKKKLDTVKVNPKEKSKILKGTKPQHNREVKRAKQLGLHAFKNHNEISTYLKRGKLVKIEYSPYFVLNDNEIGSAINDPNIKEKYKVLLPHTKLLLYTIAKDFNKKFNYPLTINSLTRTQEYLGKMRNSNKSPSSSHVYGSTFDITYKNLTSKQIEWLENTFAKLEKAGKIEAVKENKNSTCFHIMDRFANKSIKKSTKKKKKK